MIRLQPHPFDPEAELRAFREKAGAAGAVASFCGFVRAEAGSVEALELQHYPGLCEQEISRMTESARARFDIADVFVLHRFGRMMPGEPIVLVAASAAHRKPALEAVDFLMDYLKTSAPFWKRETTTSGERWIEPTTSDYSAVSAWSQKEKA